MQHPFAADGLCSTVEDLVLWNEALHGRRFLSEGSYQLMTAPVRLDSGTAFPYGFGLALDSPHGSPVISHDGGIPGFASSLAYFPDQKLTVAVLANSSSPAAEDLIATVMKANSRGCDWGAASPPNDTVAGGPHILSNGGFESGDFAGWTVHNQFGGHGDWFVYAGATSPLSCTLLGPVPEGAYAATTEPCGQFRRGPDATQATPPASSDPPARCIGAEDGPGSHVLYRDIALAPAMAHELNFVVYYRNQAGTFASPPTLDFNSRPNQQFRVDLLRASADPTSVDPVDVLATVFQTRPGDPPTLAATPVIFDVSPFAGTTIRLRFAEVDNMFMFQVASMP
jgi:hypothetical protein